MSLHLLKNPIETIFKSFFLEKDLMLLISSFEKLNPYTKTIFLLLIFKSSLSIINVGSKTI